MRRSRASWPVARPRRQQPEKAEQARVLHLLRSVGAATYTLGSRRATRCAHCGEYSTDMSTRQTPGLCDIYAFLPLPRLTVAPPIALWVEVKAGKGRTSAEQDTFADLCRERDIAHVTGGVNEVGAFLIAGGWLSADHVPHYRRPAAAGPPTAQGGLD